MNVRRVRRLWGVLLVSQFRSGRPSSDPAGFFGRSYAMLVIDALVFAGAAAVGDLLVEALSGTSISLSGLVDQAAPFVPFLGVGAVAIAGVLFELTASARFSGSDAANWLPISPAEYVLASASAIATSYSPVVVALLGGLLPLAVAGGALPTYLLGVVLGALGLLEGGLLVEIVRSVSQRSGGPSWGRFGPVAIVVRAALIVVVIVVFDLAFNPIYLIGFLDALAGNPVLTAAVPLFWATEAVIDAARGEVLTATAFAVADVGFVGLVAFAAASLRRRFWVPTGGEIEIGGSTARPGHPFLATLGLRPPEAALVSKDLRGLVRRRDMVPILALPAVLVLLLAIESPATGGLGEAVWSGWVVGFFALLLSTRCVGQERRSFQTLFAYPIRPGMLFRAKAASVLLPALVAGAGLTLAAALLAPYPPAVAVEMLLLNGTTATLLTVWGLGFAARYSDFQDRPRPQFLQPGPMLAALASGTLVLFSVYVPAALAILGSATGVSVYLTLAAIALAVTIGGGSYAWARSGFDRLATDPGR